MTNEQEFADARDQLVEVLWHQHIERWLIECLDRIVTAIEWCDRHPRFVAWFVTCALLGAVIVSVIAVHSVVFP